MPPTRKLHITEHKRPASSPPYKYAYVGRWHSNKGPDILMQCLLSLDAEDWQNISEIRIYGGSPQETVIHDIYTKLVAQNRPFSVGGYLDKIETSELYHWMDYLIIPSRIESIPLVFSDAMQARCPVISMPVGDLPKLMKEFSPGIIAADVSIKALRDAIRLSITASPTQFQTGIVKSEQTF